MRAQNPKSLIANTTTAIETILRAPELKGLSEKELNFITKAVIVDELKSKLRKEVTKHQINKDIKILKQDWLSRFESKHTRRSFDTNLQTFLDWLPKDKNIADVNARVADSYISYLQNAKARNQEKRLSKNTQIQRVAACSSFWSSLVRWRILEINPWHGSRKPKKEITIKRGEQVPTEAELEALQCKAKNAMTAIVAGHATNTRRKNQAGRMAYAALIILRETGLRVGALETLKIDRDGYFSARTKGSLAAGRLSKASVTKLCELGLNPNTPFKGYKPGTFAVWIWRTSSGMFSAHAIRHFAATSFYTDTKDIVGLQKLLGHKSLLATQAYMATLGLQ